MTQQLRIPSTQLLVLIVTSVTILATFVAPRTAFARQSQQSQQSKRSQRERPKQAPNDPFARRFSVDWQSAPIRTTLSRFAENAGFDLVVDRRVDPSLFINLSAKFDPVGKILYEAAESVDCGVVWLDKVAYVARREDAAQLLVAYDKLHTEIRGFPTSQKRKLLSSSAMEWPRLSTPSGVLQTLRKKLPLDFAAIALPHDLLPATAIKSARNIDQFVLLTYGFDLLPSVQNGSLLFSKMKMQDAPVYPMQLKIARRNRVSVDQLRNVTGDSDLELESEASRLMVSAKPATLLKVKQFVDVAGWESQSDRPASDDAGVFTMRSKQQIGSVVKAAAKKLELELVFAPELRELLIRRVDMDVTQVNAEQLIQAALRGSGLTYRIAGKQILIERE